jgi:phosphohistidine phosphatase
MGVNLDVIISSPKKRSQQTAAIVAKELALATDKIIETDRVKPMAPAANTIDFLVGLLNRNRILIAGHLPSIAEIASFLLAEQSKVMINFEMGGVCRIDVETLPTHSGVLQWYLRPDQLRLLGE